MRTQLISFALLLVPLVACKGPTDPSAQELLNGLTMTPSAVEVPLGGRQQFTITSHLGSVEGAPMYVRPPRFTLYDGECDCLTTTSLGRWERIDHDKFEYSAPTQIRRSYRLPAVAEITVDTNVPHDTVVLGTITISR